jgi:V/A-type H+-transporting ATPase subunit C
MVKSRTLVETLALLRETPFAPLHEVYSRTGDLKAGELELLKREIALYTEMEKYIRGDVLQVVYALLLRFEIDNLKNAMRIFFDRQIRGRSYEMASHYLLREKIVHVLPLDDIINAGNFQTIVDSLAGTPYSAIVERYMDNVREKGSLFFLEMGLDHHFFSNLIKQIENLDKRDRKEASRLIGVEIDLLNVAWLFRLKEFRNLDDKTILSLIIPHGLNLGEDELKQTMASRDMTAVIQTVVKSSYPGLHSLLSMGGADSSARLAFFERILDRILVYEIQRIMTGYPFTIGIILSYFFLKTNEIKKVRTILNAKQYELSPERIRGAL